MPPLTTNHTKQPLRLWGRYCMLKSMIKSLSITNFRNHECGRITTYEKNNIIIVGPNGAGKTAILEAVSVLSGDRGMRGAAMNELARFDGNGGFSIFAELNNETQIAIQYNPGDTNRRAKIDGDNAPLSELARNIRVIWITPKEDRLFVDSVSDRRAFFDRLATSFDASHAGRTAKLSKLMSERAGALKNNADTHWLDAIDTQIAGTAVAVADARIKYASELNYFLSRCAISVSGMLEQMLIDGMSAGDIERKYLQYLRENRLLVGDKMILDGPHKSDFGIFNQKLNLPAHLTSTGQQKTVLIDLILAHAKLVHAKTNQQIIILLDEAAAHLDENARNKMFEELGAVNAQVWATGLEKDTFSNIKNAVFVTCHNGQISNILVAE